MYVAAVITFLVYVILWAVSRKISVEGRGIRPILRMAAWIYQRMSDILGENHDLARVIFTRDDLDTLPAVLTVALAQIPVVLVHVQ